MLAANVEGMPHFLVSGRTYANTMAVVKESGEPVYLNENGMFGPNPVVLEQPRSNESHRRNHEHQ